MATFVPAARVDRIRESPSVAAAQRVRELKAQGRAAFVAYVMGGDPDASRWVLEDLRLTHEDAVVGALESAAA